MRIAFYAPLKGPDHPVPSGDRQMARLLIQALRAAGHTVELASLMRSFLPRPEAARMAEVEGEAEVEAEALAAAWSLAGAAPPEIWFTYHPFYKAPDFLGPRLAGRFAIPYVTAEASNAPKRAGGPWAAWHAATEGGLKAASLHFCFTDRDQVGLEALLGPNAKLIALPPFIDPSAFTGPAARQKTGTVELVTVAMMRPGDKMRSFAFLAQALALVPVHLSWRLSIIGDGPARADVEAAFAAFQAERLSYLGRLATPEIGAALRNADLYVWPGFNEAYGVSYLEAGAAGLAALAMDCGGVASVVRHGETGLLTPEGNVDAYARALTRLIVDENLRSRLGEAAKAFVTGDRTVSRAAAILNMGLGAVTRPVAKTGRG